MKTVLQVGTLFLGLGLATAAALAQTNPGNQPPGGKGQPKAAPAPKGAPMQPAAQAGPAHPGLQAGAPHAGVQASPMHAGAPPGHPSVNSRLMPQRGGPSRYSGGGTMHQQPGYGGRFMPQPRPAYGVANRGNRGPSYARPYGIRPQRFVRYGENPATWSPRYRGAETQRYGGRDSLRYGYTPRPYRYGYRYQESAQSPIYNVAADDRRLGYRHGYRRGSAAAYVYRRPAYSYAPRLSYYGYGYRPRVRYAYAQTPYAYDLPRETYATGIFATASTVGLHTYDYAYTTRVRPIAAYGGATGSYAGGYPIYNRPLAPAYPTPRCDCD